MKLHIDIDCFFVSAHRINNKQYQSIPLAVGGRSNLSIFDTKKSKRVMSQVDGAFTSSILSSNDDKTFEEYFLDENKKVRGIITTSSYEAREFGVKTAMSVSEALRWCPNLKVLPPNYPLYHELSHKFKLLLEKEIPSIEQFSIDEFFGDVTGWIDDKDVFKFACRLKEKIYTDLGLPVSIGVSKSKWIAKLATEYAKPYGVKYVDNDEVKSFIKDIKISKFPGIGSGYQKRLEKYNIKTLGEIEKKKELFYSWGKPGIQLYNRVCGTDNEKISLAQSRKSIGLGRTFDAEVSRDEIKRRITILCRHLSFIALKGKHKPLTYAMKIRYQYGDKSSDFINTNRIFNELFLKQVMIKLFDKVDIHRSHSIIQLNLTLSNFEENKKVTMDILHYEEDSKQSKLTDSMQKLRDKYGIDIIKSAGELK
ncbi:MAG: DNA polymerase IV [Campylobacterota bacterium]|nr:DNA polymerase IV [Campylobacterota bacterium]